MYGYCHLVQVIIFYNKECNQTSGVMHERQLCDQNFVIHTLNIKNDANQQVNLLI